MAPVFLVDWQGTLSDFDIFSTIPLASCLAAFKKNGCDIFVVTDGNMTLGECNRNLHFTEIAAKEKNAMPADTSFRDMLNGVITSSAIGRRKEEPEYWPAILERYAFDKNAIILIDDGIWNIRSAEESGVTAIHYNADNKTNINSVLCDAYNAKLAISG